MVDGNVILATAFILHCALYEWVKWWMHVYC